MSNISREATRVTYSRLSKVLTKLGFVRKETKDFTAYRETEHGALIVLPNMNADSTVGDPHLVTVRNTVMGKGVASLDQFQALLIGHYIKPTGSKLKSRPTRRHYACEKPRKSLLKVNNQQPAQDGRTLRKPGIKRRFSSASGE